MDWDFGNNTWDLLTTERTKEVTFSNAGNQIGIFLPIYLGTAGKTLTIKLQENVASVWTDRTTNTFNQVTGNWKAGIGNLLWFPLTSYAVTTAGSTWRYSVQANAGGTCYWARTTTASDWGYAVALDFSTATPSSGDGLIFADGITYTIDQSQTWGTIEGYTGYISNNTIVQWENPPVSSYTLTLNVPIYLGAFGTINMGTTGAKIPNAQIAIIDLTTAGAAIYMPTAQFNGEYAITAAVKIYGEEQANVHAFVAADAAAGQAVVVTETDMSALWSAGDNVTVIGKATAANDTTVYTISSISGTSVTLSANLNFIVRTGAVILNRVKGILAGVKLYNSGAGTNRRLFSNNFQSGGLLNLSGIWCYNCGIGGATVTANTVGRVWNKIFIDATQRNDSIACTITNYGTFTGSSTIRDTISNLWHYQRSSDLAAFLSCGTYCDVSNVFTRNTSQATAITIGGAGTTVTGMVFGGMNAGSTSFGMRLGGASNTYSNCLATGAGQILFCSASASTFSTVRSDGGSHNIQASGVGTTFTDCEFGAVLAATTSDVFAVTGAIIKLIFNNCKVGTTGVTNNTNMLPSSYLRFQTYNQTTNDHRGWETLGKYVSTGTSLTDTTVHTAGGFALRREPLSSTVNYDWEFDIPTGNIQNETKTIAVWCKINSATYYAGTHTNPTLTVNYDNGTTTTSPNGVATNTTAWQLLSVTFTPATTYGQITITISGATDATTTNAYFYIDDFTGGSLVNGSLDLWGNALPISPVYSFLMQASDFWDAQSSAHVGTGTMGKIMNKLLTLARFIGLK